MHHVRVGYLAGTLLGAMLGVGCTPLAEDVTQTSAAILGQSGDFTVSGQQTPNQYAVLAADVAAGSRAITVQDLTALPGLKEEDVLFIIQMQGAAIDQLSDAPRYGEVLDLRSAGRYELVTVTGVDAATGSIRIRSRGSQGLKFDYAAAGHTQVVRVPQYQNLVIPAGASIVASPWNGSTGGVVVLTAASVQVDGAISASGAGFRGGQVRNGTSNANFLGYRTTDANIAGERGEGIGGGAGELAASGSYGRGAAANGGGGGSNINSPGGGGANGLATGKLWTGQGVMDISTAGYQTAWMLDPAYDATNRLFADAAGGGRGGYGCSSLAADPLTRGPSAGVWGCGDRPNLGGLGGRPLASDVRGRLFLGGGGGAGQANNNSGGSGGSGGGLVFVLARSVAGAGSITADGAPGAQSGTVTGTASDGPGGGGGGGTIVVMAAQSIGGLQISARGGAGGNMQPQNNALEGEGGGGGGGGGFVALVGPATAQPSVTGGAAGTTSTAAFAAFPMNGATGGASGAVSLVAALNQDLPPPLYASDVQVTVGLGTQARPGYSQAPFYATYTNLGPDPASDVRATITLPAGVSGVVTRSGAFTCTQMEQVITCTVPTLTASQVEIVEVLMTLPREPGPLTVQAAATSGSFDSVSANDQASIDVQVAGYVQLSGYGFGCAVGGGGGRGAAAGWALLGLPLLLLGLRRRGARALTLLAGLALGPACSSVPAQEKVNVQFSVVGQGEVRSVDGLIACGTQCQAQVDPGTQISLTARPAEGQRFVKWEGRCQGTDPACNLAVLDDSQATATFETLAPSCFDGIQNAGETAVDCGGSCAPCEDGRSCQAGSDCASAQCVSGLCTSCPLGKELVINGDAEAGPTPTTFLPGWQSNLMVANAYGATGFPTKTDPGPASRGTYFFYAGNNAVSTASQGIDLGACAALIDKGVLTATLAAYLGGFTGQDDSAKVDARFQDAQKKVRNTATIGPVLNADRANATGLVLRTTTADVQAGTRAVSVTLTSTRLLGASNDGYADNLSLMLSLKP